MTELIEYVDFLVNRWCESRNLEPLRMLLNGKESLNGLTDGWEEFRFELRTIRAQFAHELPEDEIDSLVAAIDIADEALERSDT